MQVKLREHESMDALFLRSYIVYIDIFFEEFKDKSVWYNFTGDISHELFDNDLGI
jgi:hypothetical protein